MLVWLFLLACSSTSTERVCHGSTGLCDQPLDEVALVMTHNGMSSAEEGWLGPNQNIALAGQLTDGVRGFMLDTYEVDDEVVLCHGFCEFGQRPLVDALGDLAAFLDENPNDPLVIVFQDGASPEATIATFESIGLDERTYAHDGGPWPTLGELADAGTPLVVTTEGNNADAAPWYHHAYSEAWDNPYSAKTVDDFSCEVLRGDPDNPIFLLNHFLTNPVAYPELAEQANTYDSLRSHVDACEDRWDDRVAWLSVDFYDIGDVMTVVDELNEERLATP